MSAQMQPSPPSSVLVVVPVYNHAATLPGVVRAVLAVHPQVLVVDDGSGDLPPAPVPDAEGLAALFTPGAGHPLAGLPVQCIRHGQNRGKGAAIMTAAALARQLGMTHILTIDADGQHDAGDIPAFLQAAAQNPLDLVVGERDFATENVPASSRFGRRFSNFWFTVHTGKNIGDVQSGFRLYPLTVLEALHCRETRYSFEVEVLVRASWAGFTVTGIPVAVRYPPRDERISHFKPLADNLRISLLNTRLTIRAIMPVPQKRFAADGQGKITALRPLRSLRLLLAEDATPKNLALGAALGMGLGALPLVGLHSILILLCAGAMKANKIAGLAVSQLCMPPFVPALCVELGHYLRHGRLLTEISLQTIGYEAPQRIWEWVLGSLLLAPFLAAVFGLTTWVLALGLRRSLREGLPGSPHASSGISGGISCAAPDVVSVAVPVAASVAAPGAVPVTLSAASPLAPEDGDGA